MEKSSADSSSSFSFESFKSPLENPESDRCSLNRFENKTILHILKKLTDLKTLCRCRAVTKKIASIAILVDNISFTTPLKNPNPVIDHNEIERHVFNPEIRYPLQGESFKSAMKSLKKFKLVKSLNIQIPSPCLTGLDDCILMKWKLVFGNNEVAPYVFMLFVKSISDGKGKKLFVGVEPHDFTKHLVSQFCAADAVTRQRMLSYYISDFPLLEKCSISDLEKRGRLSVSCGRVIHQLRNDLDNNNMEVVSKCRVPSLKLPVSGYVMKGVHLLLMHREAAYVPLGCSLDFFNKIQRRFDVV